MALLYPENARKKKELRQILFLTWVVKRKERKWNPLHLCICKKNNNKQLLDKIVYPSKNMSIKCTWFLFFSIDLCVLPFAKLKKETSKKLERERENSLYYILYIHMQSMKLRYEFMRLDFEIRTERERKDIERPCQLL